MTAWQRGSGVVWVPARGILTTAAFPPKTTFDSSRTPKRGEVVSSAALKPINLEKIELISGRGELRAEPWLFVR